MVCKYYGLFYFNRNVRKARTATHEDVHQS